jgi:hypothetical protein
LVGLDERDAQTLAARNGCQVRAVRRDGNRLVTTLDYRVNRINVWVVGNVVVGIQDLG